MQEVSAPSNDEHTAPSGAAAAWDSEYRDGRWDHLESLDEISHYMVIAGYLLYAPANPAVLDVGCGPGRLLRILHRLGFGSYHGLDLSGAAIERAAGLEIPDTTFETADFTAWEPDRRFDAIVFNESLYYAPSPMSVLSRCRDWLTEHGVVVVSMWRHGNVERIWKAIDADPSLRVVADTAVHRSRRERWNVKMLRPVPEARSDRAAGRGL